MSSNDARLHLAARAVELCEHDTRAGYVVETDDLARRAFEASSATAIEEFGRDAVLRHLKITVRNWFGRQRTETGQPAYENVVMHGRRVYVAAQPEMFVQLTVGYVLDRRAESRRELSTARLKSDLWDALGGALPEGADRDSGYGSYVGVTEIAQLIESAAA